jgi:PAS domain S-box-containing protein
MVERKQMQEALQESEERYRNLFENANDMIATFTLDGVITGVNRGLEVALGWSREELIGQHYSKLATPAALALADEHTRRALVDEPLPSIFEAEIVRKDGWVVPIEVRSRFIRDAERKPIGIQGIFRDLTERKRMEDALKACETKYQTIFAASPDFIYLTDSEGKLLDANPALLDWQGLSLAELQQRHFLDFFAGDNLTEIVQAFAALQQGHIVRGLEVQARNGRGETKEFEVNATPLQNCSSRFF